MEQNEKTTEQIAEMFLKTLPQFKESQEYKLSHQDIPYVMMGAFGDFLVRFIDETPEPENNKIIQDTFRLINHVFSVPKLLNEHGTIDVIQLQIFEPLAINKKSKELANKLLESNAKDHFSVFR